MTIVSGQIEFASASKKKQNRIKVKAERTDEIEAALNASQGGLNLVRLLAKYSIVIFHLLTNSIVYRTSNPAEPYTCLVGLILMIEWIDFEIKHLLKNSHTMVDPKLVEEAFQEFLKEDDREEPTTEELSGLENTFLGKCDVLLMKDCGFRWEAKAATAHERDQKRKKEEEYELNQRFRKWERKKRFEERVNRMHCQSSLSHCSSYTLNTVAEGGEDFALYQDLSGSRILQREELSKEEEPYAITFDNF